MNKQLDAEGVAVRKRLFGADSEATEKADSMGDNIILGDNTHPTPIVISHQPQQSSGTLGKVLVGAALAAGLIGIPAAGVIGYGLSKLNDKPEASSNEDTSLDIGLGRIEDLLPR